MKILNSRNKILISVIALVVALTVAVGSTYAWFTMGNTVTLDNFQVGVTTETDNLFVAAGTINDTLGTPETYNYGDLKSISTAAGATYDIDTNTYKIALSQKTINDILIHQYGAMVAGADGFGTRKNYALIPFTDDDATVETTEVKVQVGTGYAQNGVTYYNDAACTDTATVTVGVTDVSKLYVKGNVVDPNAADTEYFYYFDEATHAFVVISRTGEGTGDNHFVYSTEVIPNTAMDALTTTDGENFTRIDGVTAVPAISPEDGMANYTEFKVYFRSTSAAYSIALGQDSEVTAFGRAASKVKAWKTITEAEYGKAPDVNGNVNARAADAVRISFDNGTDTYIWNPNENTGYFKGNLADDYWGYLHADVPASQSAEYRASYNAYLAREYKVTNDAAAQAGVTYYTSTPRMAYAPVTTADDYAEKFVIDTIAACTGTSVFEKGKAYYVGSNTTPDGAEFSLTGMLTPDSYTIGENIDASAAAGDVAIGQIYAVTFKAGNATGVEYSATTKYYSSTENVMIESDFAVGAYEKTTLEKCSETVDGENVTHNNGTILTTLAYNPETNYYEGTLTVRIWLEGWDGDCFDDILAEYFETMLCFDGHAVQA